MNEKIPPLRKAPTETWEQLLKRVLTSLASRVPSSPVSEMLGGHEIDRVSYYILTCCLRDRRFSDISRNWGHADQAARDDMHATVREVLLATSFDYQGNTATVRYLAATCAHALRRLHSEWVSINAIDTIEPVAPDTITPSEAQIFLHGLCTVSDISVRKFIVLNLLVDTAGYTHQQVLHILEAPAAAFIEHDWRHIRGNLPLPDWPTVHGWFQAGPPILRIAAVEQFMSRCRSRLRRQY